MKKRLHMIGNSHIDPVWFWTREEGMQEVCATFASALDRMDEYPDFKYTCTSAAFFAFVEQARPDLLRRIRRQVEAGRFELTGGWWIEPDCCLPCGESLVREGLYGQRTFLRLFGRMAGIGSNVDSFGHSLAIPQILRGCRMTRYVFMRPSLTRSKRAYMPRPAPLVNWQAPDGSRVTALSLPAEYTCWFEESLRESVDNTLAAMGDAPSMACFYGVGNHGGGPTKANIEAIGKIAKDYPQAELRLSTLKSYFDEAEALPRPLLTAHLEHINTGCYSVDHRYKRQIRGAEQALLRAERLAVAAELAAGIPTDAAQFAPLWQRLMFCQFHDTLGGTEILEARENAMRDVGGVWAQAETLAQTAVQRIANSLDTRGDGQPVLLLNDTARPFDGMIDAELSWFCNDPLTLRGEDGEEIPYQRVKQSCTMKWYHLGGRRRVLFRARIPAFGCTVLRAFAQEPKKLSALPPSDSLTLENALIRARVDEAGRLCSLTDKRTGFEALTAPVSLCPWRDEGDSWGHRSDDRVTYEKPPFRCEEARRVETGAQRNTVRLRYRGEEGEARLLLHLDEGEPFLRVEMHVLWRAPWHRLNLVLPVGYAETRAEGPMCEMPRAADDGEYYMHRYVDALRPDGGGLLVVNDGVYAYHTQAGGALAVTLLRSAIYAHSNCVGWYDENDSYDYADIGEHRYTFLLMPHGAPLAPHERLAAADRLSSPPIVLADMKHPGCPCLPSAEIAGESVRLEAFKPGEDGGVTLRLRETDGAACACRVSLAGTQTCVRLRPFEIKTLALRGGVWHETDMLEMIEDEKGDHDRQLPH